MTGAGEMAWNWPQSPGLVCLAKCLGRIEGWCSEKLTLLSRGETAAWPDGEEGDEPGRQCHDAEDRPSGPGPGGPEKEAWTTLKWDRTPQSAEVWA